MTRAEKRRQQKLARKSAKPPRIVALRSGEQVAGGFPAGFVEELVQKGVQLHLAGRVMDAEKMTGEINRWLKQYCRQGTMDDVLAAKYPLKEINVTAEPVPGKPGMFKSLIQMIPHFKLKGVEVELSMVGQFDPPPG